MNYLCYALAIQIRQRNLPKCILCTCTVVVVFAVSVVLLNDLP